MSQTTQATPTAGTGPLLPQGRLPAAVNSEYAPSAVIGDGSVYVFYRGAGDDTGIYFTQTASPGGLHWTDLVRLPGEVNTSAAPDALWAGGTIYVFYTGLGDTPNIFVARSSDAGGTWSMTSFGPDVNTATRPSGVLRSGALGVLYRGIADAGIYGAMLGTDATWTPIA